MLTLSALGGVHELLTKCGHFVGVCGSTLHFGHTTKSRDHRTTCSGKLASTSCWLESCKSCDFRTVLNV